MSVKPSTVEAVFFLLRPFVSDDPHFLSSSEVTLTTSGGRNFTVPGPLEAVNTLHLLSGQTYSLYFNASIFFPEVLSFTLPRVWRQGVDPQYVIGSVTAFAPGQAPQPSAPAPGAGSSGVPGDWHTLLALAALFLLPLAYLAGARWRSSARAVEAEAALGLFPSAARSAGLPATPSQGPSRHSVKGDRDGFYVLNEALWQHGAARAPLPAEGAPSAAANADGNEARLLQEAEKERTLQLRLSTRVWSRFSSSPQKSSQPSTPFTPLRQGRGSSSSSSSSSSSHLPRTGGALAALEDPRAQSESPPLPIHPASSLHPSAPTPASPPRLSSSLATCTPSAPMVLPALLAQRAATGPLPSAAGEGISTFSSGTAVPIAAPATASPPLAFSPPPLLQLAAGASAAAPAPPPDCTKFLKMLKMGVPREAVTHKMQAEGFSPAQISHALQGGGSSSSSSGGDGKAEAANSSTSPTPSSHQLMPPPPTPPSLAPPPPDLPPEQRERYTKMLRMGVPQAAVRVKMASEGIAAGTVAVFFGEAPPQPPGAVAAAQAALAPPPPPPPPPPPALPRGRGKAGAHSKNAQDGRARACRGAENAGGGHEPCAPADPALLPPPRQRRGRQRQQQRCQRQWHARASTALCAFPE